MHNNKLELDNAVLVGVGVGNNIEEHDLDELSSLCLTCNIKEVARVIQNRKDIDVTYYVGKGKVEEIKELVDKHDATVVVFDVELSGSKARNLEMALGVPVLDRSKVILDIFAQRAQSMEGKLQVELAQLRYNLPRLRNSPIEIMAKMKNSVGMRGPGEKKLELDKRSIRDEITLLEKKLESVSLNRETNRKRASSSGKTRVAIVGYTNSGKSTLLNTISKAGVVAEDKLFATLDPKTANVYLKNENIDYTNDKKGSGVGAPGYQILMTDTVGFINKLPHEFIRAFESTLDEARQADLLLHVVDIANPEYEQQIQVVNQVLAKIGADHIPIIMVYNKADSNRLFKDKGGVIISAKKNTGIDQLKQKIIEFIEKRQLK